jgi:uncharacterized membrane protein
MLAFVSWTGTVTSILGSFAVATRFFLLGYSLFIVGSFCWLAIAAIRRDRPLAVLNGTFLIANLIGLYNNA